MASEDIHIHISGRLQDHIRRQTGENGLYENAGDYIRALIRRDMQRDDEAWSSLKHQIEPGLRAGEDEFVAVTAEDVIRRNTSR